MSISADEFAALPPAMALKLLAEHPSIAKYLDKLELPVVPRSPKYDRMIFTKTGHQWASETQLRSLEHFANRSKESADRGGDYVEKDLDQYKRLMYWVEFRRVEPTLAVSLTRGDDMVTAAAPAYNPEIHPKQQRRQSEYNPSQTMQGEPPDSSDVPF